MAKLPDFYEPALLSVPEVARRLGLGRGTVYKLLREDRIHGIVIGQRWVVSATEVDAFVDRETRREEVAS